jgi:DNA-binding transcriptional LysR family regulator
VNESNLARADLNLLVLFQVVMQEGHVTRAARRLRVTPSAVSHGLKRLRQLLNDPLFLRTPKGVTPTARASELAEPIADILARVDGVFASAEPFDAATSTRRFTIGAPDDVSAVFLPALLTKLRSIAPRVDIGVRLLLPPRGGQPIAQAWEPVLEELEARTIDIAIAPLTKVPVRFVSRTLYDEDFVVAMRKGHPFARRPTLDRYCEMQHIVVSMSGDPHGLFDELLAKQERHRRVALTVPNFMQALAHVATTDLIAALPRRLVATYAAQFGLTSSELPVTRRPDGIRAVVTEAALMDPGVAWLFHLLQPARARRTDRR